MSRYVFTLFGTTVSWKSNLQSIVALSTTESEYNALAKGVKEGIWLKGMLHELGIEQETIQIHLMIGQMNSTLAITMYLDSLLFNPQFM